MSDQATTVPKPFPEVNQRRYFPVWEITKARLKEFLREPEAIFWVYGFPILMTVALGIAFREKGVEQFTVDIASNPKAEQLAQWLKEDPNRFNVQINDRATFLKRLAENKTALVIQPSEQSNAQTKLQLTYLFDQNRPESALAHQTVDDFLQRKMGRKDPMGSKTENFQQAGGRYIDFLIPGLLGMGLMGGGLWGLGFVTVDMRIRKLLKRFLATPMRRKDFLLALMISRFLFMIPEILILLSFAYFFFGVTIHGSALLLLLAVIVGAMAFAGLGLLVASRAKTIEAVSGLMNLVMLPMWVLSGIFFSSDRFPEVVQPFIQALPLTVLNNVLRGIINQGQTLATVGPSLLILAAWGILTFLIALRIFRWE